jgi:hypothetical protein
VGAALDRALSEVSTRARETTAKVVLVEPFTGLNLQQAGDLKRQLLAAPTDRTVVLVVRRESDIPA